MKNEKDFNSLLNETRKINEYFDADLVGYFDQAFVGDTAEEYGVTEELAPIIAQAREVVVAWTKQLKDAGATDTRDILGRMPEGWLEGSDGWDMAADGDISGLQQYLQEIIDYGPVLDI